MSDKTAIVIPNWNGQDHIRKCLDSLKNVKAKIIVVDNGSEDGSVEIIKNNYPEVELIGLAQNRGFSGGVNVGIKKSLDCEFIALLNNDAVVEPDWLNHLIKKAKDHPKVGIITSKILRSDKKHLDSTGDFYSIWGLPFPRGRNEKDEGQYDNKTEVFGASGGASLYRVKMLKEIGLFDEDFFAYFEDVDLSFRAQLAGWRILYEPKAVVYHHVGGTSEKLGNFSRYHSIKNFILLFNKNMPGKLAFKYGLLFDLQYFRWLLTSALRGHLWTFIKASLVALYLLPKILIKRRKIQKSRKVSVEYIDSILYKHRPPKPAKVVK